MVYVYISILYLIINNFVCILYIFCQQTLSYVIFFCIVLYWVFILSTISPYTTGLEHYLTHPTEQRTFQTRK